jgi:diguanylate cyclase (GGDEF)-like protein/PAS domain S-box-containing protein
LRQVIDLLPDILWVEDWQSGNIILYNHKADINLAVGRNQKKYFTLPLVANLVHPDDSQKIDHFCQQIGRPDYKKGMEIEARVLDNSGNWRFFRCSVAVVARGVSGDPRQVLWLLRDLTEQRQLEECLRSKVYRDSLTGLFNRTFFDEQIARWNAEWYLQVAIIVIDIDGLKRINDLSGHLAGDSLLQSVGLMLRNAFREDDAVARIGGDEFAILLPGASSTTVHLAVQRIRKMIWQHNQTHPEQPISMSIGAAIRREEESLQVTFQRADEKMYQNKLNRKLNMTHPEFNIRDVSY